MVVSNILDVIDDNVNVYVHNVYTKELITYYDGKNSIDTELLVYPVEHMYTNDIGSIVLEVMYGDEDFQKI